MTTQLHDTGEEIIIRDFFEESITKPTDMRIGLFNDSLDTLGDSDDIGQINNESDGASYGRIPLNFGTTDFTAEDNASTNWQVVFSDVTFDTTDSTVSVDAYFTVLDFASKDANDGGTTNTHLLFTGSLDQSYDLSQIDSFTLSGAGLEIN